MHYKIQTPDRPRAARRNNALPGTAPDPADVDAAVTAALAEDLGTGDITTDALVPADATLNLIMAARQDMVAAGLPVAREVFRRLAPAAALGVETSDGTSVAAGTVMLRIAGPARGLLSGERPARTFVPGPPVTATPTRAHLRPRTRTGPPPLAAPAPRP